MSEIKITCFGGKKKRLLTAGKYCTENIIVEVPASGGGECSGEHVIPVDELPTENIDTNAVYLCKGAYYKYGVKLVDVKVSADSLGANGYYYVETKPTENIAVSNIENGAYVYYVVDENNLFLYGDFSGTGENKWQTLTEFYNSLSSLNVPFGGIISDASEATQFAFYAVVQTVWTHYTIAPSGTSTFYLNGTYDVSSKETVVVNVPDASVVGIWKFNDSITKFDGGRADINFSSSNPSGNLQDYVFLGTSIYNGSLSLYYATGEESLVYDHIYIADTGWKNDACKYINFGAEPQMVYSEFKNWLVANATPIYTITQTE